jgi:hypothetical protein
MLKKILIVSEKRETVKLHLKVNREGAVTAADTSHAVTLAVGDLLAVKVVSSAGTATGPFCTFQVT